MGNTSRREPVEVFWGEMSACEHFVQVYRDDDRFLDTLESFIGDGLRAGEATVVLATPEHLRALEDRLNASGLDLVALRWQGRYLPMEATRTLAEFMVNGWPDQALFNSTITQVIRLAQREGRKVRAFGELVALLWAQGHHGATVQLEHMWHELCGNESLALFCAYPHAGFTQDATASIAELCAVHSRVLAAV